MATEGMNAIALLKADHRKVEGLFETFESAKSAAKKQALAQEVCTELLVHTYTRKKCALRECSRKRALPASTWLRWEKE